MLIFCCIYRSVIFERTFRTYLDEKEIKRNSNEKNPSNSAANKKRKQRSLMTLSSIKLPITMNDLERKSKKINYDALTSMTVSYYL